MYVILESRVLISLDNQISQDLNFELPASLWNCMEKKENLFFINYQNVDILL